MGQERVVYDILAWTTQFQNIEGKEFSNIEFVQVVQGKALEHFVPQSNTSIRAQLFDPYKHYINYVVRFVVLPRDDRKKYERMDKLHCKLRGIGFGRRTIAPKRMHIRYCMDYSIEQLQQNKEWPEKVFTYMCEMSTKKTIEYIFERLIEEAYPKYRELSYPGFERVRAPLVKALSRTRPAWFKYVGYRYIYRATRAMRSFTLDFLLEHVFPTEASDRMYPRIFQHMGDGIRHALGRYQRKLSTDSKLFETRYSRRSIKCLTKRVKRTLNVLRKHIHRFPDGVMLDYPKLEKLENNVVLNRLSSLRSLRERLRSEVAWYMDQTSDTSIVIDIPISLGSEHDTNGVRSIGSSDPLQHGLCTRRDHHGDRGCA